MKILLCKSQLEGPVSGADETLVTYATHLARHGQRVAVALMFPPIEADQYMRRLEESGVEVFVVAPVPLLDLLLRVVRRTILGLFSLVQISTNRWSESRARWQRMREWVCALYAGQCRACFTRFAPDVIHVVTPSPGAAVMIQCGAAAGIPVLYQELGSPRVLPQAQSAYDLFTRAFADCSEVAALSPSLAQEMQLSSRNGNVVSVLPLLVEDLGEVSGPRRASSHIVFGYAGRLEPFKGPENLIDAFAAVLRGVPNVHLRMAGSGDLAEVVEARAKKLGVFHACEFPGPYPLSGKSTFMRGLDVFVLPSFIEGTPNSIIEAMACGLPVIASDVGGVPDLVTPETGILVPPGDSAALAAAMATLAADPERRHRLGRAARIRYEQLFSPPVMLPTLVEVYRRVAARGRSLEPRTVHPWI